MSPEEERLAFHSELGLAISEWAHVEYLLGVVVAKCGSKGSQSLLMKGYLSIENFRSKLQFSDNIIRQAFAGTPNIHEWPALFKRTGSLSTQRNKLVHRMAYNYREAAAGKRMALEEWLPKTARKPGALNKGKLVIKPTEGAIFLLDITRMRLEFVALTADLVQYLLKIDGKPVQPARVLEQQVGQLTIRSIRNRNRAALGLPPLPSRKKSKPEQEPSS